MQGKARDVKGQPNFGGDMDPSIVKADSSSDQEGQTFPPLWEALDSRSQGKFWPNIIYVHTDCRAVLLYCLLFFFSPCLPLALWKHVMHGLGL
jgi:hypothetical protein